MKKKEFTFNSFLPLIYIITVLIILLIFFKLAIFLMPFVIALIVVYITRPYFHKLKNLFNLKDTIANFIVISVFYLLIIGILGILLFLVFSQLISLINTLINTREILVSQLNEFINKIESFDKAGILKYSISIVGYTDKLILFLNEKGIELLNLIFSITRQLPTIFVYIVITVMSSFLMANNTEEVNRFFEKQFPKTWLEKFDLIKKDSLFALFSYIKAQLILISLTFIELFIGLSIISSFVHRIEYILFLSFAIALIDALPIVGTSPILIPWSLYNIFNGNLLFGISILMLYIIIFLLRQILEPRLLSKTLNLNPLISLVSIFIGFKLFGIIGFLIGPILFMIMMILFDKEIENGFFKSLVGEVDNEKNN